MVWRKLTRRINAPHIISTTGATAIVQLPLAFVRSGVLLYVDGLYGGGIEGSIWSHTSKSSTVAYRLLFNIGNVYPAYSYDVGRWAGFPLCCLYPGSA